MTFTEKFARALGVGISNFEMVRDRIVELSPLAKYPFVVIGLSDKPEELVINELTSELDQFLIKKTGYFLIDMVTQTERFNYDFKERLPANKKLAEEVCAFSNTSGGGLILVGIDKKGIVVGFPRAEIDATVSKVSNIARDSCLPTPKIDHHVFDANSTVDQCILIFEVYEMERKPCMLAQKKVIYVRDSSQAIPAGPENVRKIILGSGS